MSRSPDNLRGTENTLIFSGDDKQQGLLETFQDEEVGEGDHPLSRPVPHRKTQSLIDTIPVGTPRRHRGRHHRHRSSIGQLMETIGEDVKAEAKVVRHAWKRELEEADLGHRYFLDMNLTRSLSVLPEDIWEFTKEAAGVEIETPLVEVGQPHEQIDHTPKATLSSYLALLSAVLAVSSNGSALALLHGVEPAIKLFWRMSAVTLILSFFAIRTMARQYQTDGHFFPKLTAGQWMTFLAASIAFFAHTLLLFTAFTLTSIGNAIIGANSQALLLVLGKLFTGQTVVWMEGGGVLVAFAGCVLCTLGEAHGDEDKDGDKEIDAKAIIGDLLALGSAATGVMYLTFAKAVRSHMSVTVFMFFVMLSGSFLCLCYLIFAGETFTIDNDPHHGLFGWVSLVDNHVFIILYVAIVCNLVGTMGFVRAMEYFENIIIAVATLLEPMIATMIAVALGVGELPGAMGWTGNLLVAIGTLGVVYPSINDKNAGGGH